MIKPLAFVLAALLTGATGLIAAPARTLAADYSASRAPTFADIADRVHDSVVTVATAVAERKPVGRKSGRIAFRETDSEGNPDDSDDFMPSLPKPAPGEPARQFTSIGSGFVLDASGLVVTNNHVIEGGNEVYVIFPDGVQLKVDKVYGRDLKTDLTVLQVTPKDGKRLKAVTFGDSAAMRVGDWVVAVGNPFGLGGTVTSGIISGLGRDINAGPYDEFLQTDAAINRGNSGGPLFNMRGEVIGINTAIFSPSGGSIGLGFAIPSNTAKRVVDHLQRYGETHWGSIGVRIQSVSDDLAGNLHLNRASGALVARVDRGGPADAAGLAEGDVILAFAGNEIRHSRQLPRIVAHAIVGDEVDMEILRSGTRKILRVRIALLKEKPTQAKIIPGGQMFRPRKQKTFNPLLNKH